MKKLLIVVFVSVLTLFLAACGGSEPDPTPTPPPPATIVVTLSPGDEGVATAVPLPTAELPAPEPEEPKGIVIATDGLNIRSGPGAQYPVLGVAPFGAEGELIGQSEDGKWWAAVVAGAPNDTGWASKEYVEATNAEAVPVIAAPPVPATATPSSANVQWFTAQPGSVVQGQCVTLSWNVAGGVSYVRIVRNGNFVVLENAPVNGSVQDCPPAGTQTYRLEVTSAQGVLSTQETTVYVSASQNPLTNTSWQLMNINISQDVVPGSSITADFHSDNSINTFAGCNTYNGRYTVNGNYISIGQLAGTRMACGNDLDAQETTYLNALQSAVTFQILNGQLVLYNGFGQEVVRYSQR